MNNPGILGSIVIVGLGLAVPFFCLLLGWLTKVDVARPKNFRESLPRLALWIASFSLLVMLVSLVRIQMLAPTVPSSPWIALNWTSVACWALAFLMSLLGKGKPRTALLTWSITFPIFATFLFMTAYAY